MEKKCRKSRFLHDIVNPVIFFCFRKPLLAWVADQTLQNIRTTFSHPSCTGSCGAGNARSCTARRSACCAAGGYRSGERGRCGKGWSPANFIVSLFVFLFLWVSFLNSKWKKSVFS
jgi:hypothetical protein